MVSLFKAFEIFYKYLVVAFDSKSEDIWAVVKTHTVLEEKSTNQHSKICPALTIIEIMWHQSEECL